MGVKTHEIKEYSFAEKLVTKKTKTIHKVIETLLCIGLIAYAFHITVAESSHLVVLVIVLTATIIFMITDAIQDIPKQTVDSKIILFDTYMIVQRNNTEYKRNNIGNEKYAIHYDEVNQIIFDREDNALIIYKKDQSNLRIELTSNKYVGITKFIADSTPLSVEIR